MVDPMPELLRAERRLPDLGEGHDQLGPIHADQFAAAVGQDGGRRREPGGLGQDAGALGVVQVDHAGCLPAGHAFWIAA